MIRTTIRPALSSDADAVFGLLCKLAMSYTPLRAAFDGGYSRLLNGDGVDLLVAKRGGVVVGYILASNSVTLYANGTVTELLELYVVEEERSKGIGRDLVRRAVARARDRGAVEVTVPTRRAGPFYLALGFELTAEFFKLKLST